MSVISPLDSWTWLGFGLSMILGLGFMSLSAYLGNHDAGNMMFFLVGPFLDESQPETTKFRWE